MKKTTAMLLIILILLNIYSPKIYASTVGLTNVQDETLSEITNGMTAEDFNSMMEFGETETFGDETGQTTSIGPVSSFLVSVTRFLGTLFGLIPRLINYILSFITGGNEGGSEGVFTIAGLLTNQYSLFDINFFNNTTNDMNKSPIDGIKSSVSVWYVSIRNITVIGMAIVLIYVGIRMAIATVANEKAKYKKMLTYWLEAIAILFLLHYFMVLILKVSDILIDMMKTMMDSLKATNIEETMINNLYGQMQKANGVGQVIAYVILCCMMAYYELKFFIMYISRVFRVAFYMVISPLVCLIYPIDKIGDGRSQSFLIWIREYTFEVFLQCIHLGIYIVFIFSAGAIISSSPFLGVLFLATLSNGEKIVKRALGLGKHFAKSMKETRLPLQHREDEN